MQVWSFLKKCNWSVLLNIPVFYFVMAGYGYLGFGETYNLYEKIHPFLEREPAFMLWFFYSYLLLLPVGFFIAWLPEHRRIYITGYISAMLFSSLLGMVFYKFYLLSTAATTLVATMSMGMKNKY